MKKQLILISDMEGVSGVFDSDVKQLYNGHDEWRKYGREKLTSDILAVCEAAQEFGIDEILYYDAHFAGNPEYNIHIDRLPSFVKLFDVPNREFHWRRIRGQAQINPYGIITIGQHARNGEHNAYFPHTIHTPPIKALWVNNIHIAEIGTAVLSFQGVKYLANIGCAASEKEAKELSKNVKHITVKDKNKRFEPSIKETYSIIKEGVLEALKHENKADKVIIKPPYQFKLELCKYFYLNEPINISWKGSFKTREAIWQAPSIEIGLEIFNYVREYITINPEDKEKVREEILNGTYDTLV